MNEVIKICGVAMISGFCALILKKGSPELSRAVALIGLVMTFGLFLTQIVRVKDGLLGTDAYLGQYTEPVLKSLGIGLTVKVSSDILRDCGEESLSGAVESVGKGAILLLALPCLKELIELCGGFFA